MQARLQRLQDHNSYSDYYGGIDANLQSQQFAVNLVQEGLDLSLATLDALDSEVASAYEASKDPLKIQGNSSFKTVSYRLNARAQ